MKEALLESVLRRLRIGKVLPTIKQHPNCQLLDIGCGWDASLLKAVEPYIDRGVGIDFKAPRAHSGKITTLRVLLDDTLPFPDHSFDVVTMLAVLEHLSQPMQIAREIRRVMVPGGRLVITVPSRASKPVLEFLAYKLNIVSEAEIKDHKAYYDFGDLASLFTEAGLQLEQHHYFQLGMNNFCVLKK